MSRPVSPGGTIAERDAHTPRPTDEKHDYNFEPQRMQEESASSSPATDSADVQRKSFSSLSTRSGGSLSTSYSSADEHSEVGELPNDTGMSNEVRIQSERASSGSLEAGHMAEKDEGVDKLEQQLAELNVEPGDAAGKAEDETEGDDAYLDDPLVQYTIQLHDYTKQMYIDARKTHEKLELERSRGGRVGRSGIEAMGRKTAASRY